jgi:hypothetical protein
MRREGIRSERGEALSEVAIRELLACVSYRDWTFHLGREGERLFLQVRFSGHCAYSGKPEPQRGRKWLLSPHMTKSEIITTALKAALTAEEHEARERFKYRGRAIFGPHFNVDKMWELCGQGLSAIDVRAEIEISI